MVSVSTGIKELLWSANCEADTMIVALRIAQYVGRVPRGLASASR